MEMKVIQPHPPYVELKKLVVRMGGRMCSPHARRFWVIIIGGRIGVFPIVQDGHQKSFPKLDDLYEGDRLRPDAKEKLLELLDDVQWTM
ncbi:MAG: hypothetical protein OXF50_03290 [Caldilineaceae bacterium]|nr:hypothetical protein [Caldilineaceae bacterium]